MLEQNLLATVSSLPKGIPQGAPSARGLITFSNNNLAAIHDKSASVGALRSRE